MLARDDSIIYGFYGSCRFRFARTQAVLTPVSNMIGHKNVQTMVQNARLASEDACTDSSALCGPSLNKCREENVARPKQAPKARNNAMYEFKTSPLQVEWVRFSISLAEEKTAPVGWWSSLIESVRETIQ